jgi:hypothetical protein
MSTEGRRHAILNHMKVIAAQPLKDFRLELNFDNGESGIVDLSSFAGRGVCSEWKKPGVFEQVKVTDQGAVEWPGEIDFCPDALYLRMTNRRPEDLFPALRSRMSHA